MSVTTTDTSRKAPSKNYYRKFLLCSFSGAVGDYMSLIALNWYAIHVLNSMWMIGWINFLRIVPSLFMGLVGGYWADKMDRRLLIIRIYAGIVFLSVVQAVIITTLQRNNLLQPLLLSTIFVRNMFDGAEPGVRNALLPDIVGGTDLMEVVGYYASMLNLARIAAPIIAGWFLFHYGNVLIFWIDIILQLPTLIILFKLPGKKGGQHTAAAKEDVLSGFRRSVHFIRNTPLLRSTICLSIWMMLLLFPFSTMLSLYVEQKQLGPKIYGFLSGIAAAGAVLSGVFTRCLPVALQIRIWPLIAIAGSLLMLLLGFASQLWMVYVVVFLLGWFSQLFRNTNHIIFQLYTPQELRGKVLSIVFSDRGFIAIGMLLATWIASIRSVSLSFVVLGSTALTGPILFYFIKYKKAVCMLPDKNV